MRLNQNQIALLKKHPSYMEVQRIADQLQLRGRQCYIVGGGVRDLLLGFLPKDLDLVTDANPDVVKQIFANALDIGEAFGIMVIPTSVGPIELASFRKESTYSDGRHPDKIEYSTLSEDARRRDFTVNSMYLDLTDFSVIDEQGGAKDLVARTLRTVGDADRRFFEDRLRILRLVRFSIQMDFAIEPATLEAARKLNGDLKGVSPERIREEILRCFGSSRASRLPALLQAVNLDHSLLGVESLDPHQMDIWRELEVRCRLHEAARLYLFLKASKKSANEAMSWLKALKFPRAIADQIKRLFLNTAEILAHKEHASGKVFAILLEEPDNFLLEMLSAAYSEVGLTKILSEYRNRFVGKAKPLPIVDSAALIALGIKQGSDFGKILTGCWEIQLEKNLKNRADIDTDLKLLLARFGV